MADAARVSTAVCGVVGDESAEVLQLLAALATRKPAASTQHAVDALDAPTVTTTLGSGATAKITYRYCRTPAELATLQPSIVLVVFTPIVPAGVAKVHSWGSEIDRLFPRPRVVLCGTRLEMLASRKVADKMRESNTIAVPTEDAVDLAFKLRAGSYTEVSASTYVNILHLEELVAKAAVGEADKRPTTELADEARAQCIQAGSRHKRSLWVARRDKRSGRIFYFNTDTRQPQWNRPADFDGEEPEMTEAEQRRQSMLAAEREEQRKQEEREVAVMQDYIRDVAEHDTRMRDMERHSDLLTAQVAELQSRFDQLKAERERNELEREELDTLQAEYAEAAESLVSKTTSNESTLEQELRAARAKAFELEAQAAMREERDFDVQIAEAVMRNKSLSAQLRTVLQQQLEVQATGANAQAQVAVLQRRKEDSTRALSKLQQQLTTVQGQAAYEASGVAALEKEERALQHEIKQIVGRDQDRSLSAVDATRRQKKLIEACEDLDERIAQLRDATVSNDVANARREASRLRHEQRALVHNLAGAEARVAIADLRVRKLLVMHEHVVSERRQLESKLVDASTRRSRLAQHQLSEFEAGLGYSGVSRDELERLAATLEGSRVRRTTVGDGSDVAGALRQKLQMLDVEGAALRSAAKQYTEFLRAKKAEISDESRRDTGMTEAVVDTFDAIDPAHANAGNDLAQRLQHSARTALMDNAQLLGELAAEFAAALAKGARQHHVEVEGALNASMHPSFVASPRRNNTGLSSDDASVRKSYSALADRVASTVASDLHASPSRRTASNLGRRPSQRL